MMYDVQWTGGDGDLGKKMLWLGYGNHVGCRGLTVSLSETNDM